MDNKPLTENQIQTKAFRYLQLKYPKFYTLSTHVPNGGFRYLAEAVAFRNRGLRPGYPDMLIDRAAGGAHGCRIEIKRNKNGKLSELQTDWCAKLCKQKFIVIVAHGEGAVIKAIDFYCSGEVKSFKKYFGTVQIFK